MTGTVFLNISGIMYTIIIVLLFFFRKRIKSVENDIYGNLLIVTLFELIFGLLSFISFKLQWNDLVNQMIGKLFLIFMVLWSTIFTMYMLQISHSINDKAKSSFKYISYFISTIYIIICIVFNLDFISLENGGMYSFGIQTIIAYILSALYIFIMVVSAIKNVKYMNKKYIPLWIFIFLGAIFMIVQIIYPELFLIVPLEVYITSIMYHTIENPDVKMLEQLELAKDAADKANEAKSEFLSNMSHEIRTPLNAIVGFSEALKYDDLSEESMNKVNDIIMASNNLLEIVNGILDISKIEANKLEIIDKEYDIQSMLDELVALTKARIGDKGLDFKVYIDPSIPRILYGDNTRIKQVVLNLLTNAVKYTKEGYVDLKVSSVQKDKICRLIFSVEDSGIGIKKENLPKLFSKFDRMGVEKEMTIEGTGLGLAITHKLIDLMNGKIVVQSEYGKGSKFTVSIDQRIISVQKQVVKETKVSESKVINAKGAHVLIVDDNDLNIKVASTLLKKYGFIIDSASNGIECIAKLNKPNDYEIVFLDDMMPRMSGRDTIKRLKNNPEYKIPTIALTANAIEGMKEEYLACGFDDYLSKPIEKNELERVIKKYIHQINVESSNTVTSDNAQSIIEMDFELPALAMEVVKKNDIKPQTLIKDFSNKKVLLVDDNEMNLKVAEMHLKKYNLNITKCTRGNEAISKYQEDNNYDLILLDEMMPEMDGCSTLDNLRKIEGFNVPTIMMTASPKDEVSDKIIQHKFDGYVGKPIVKEELDKILTDFLNK